MSFIFWVIPLIVGLSMFWNLINSSDEANSPVIQFLLLLISAAYTFIVGYLLLVEVTVTSFLAYFGWFIGAKVLFDALTSRRSAVKVVMIFAGTGLLLASLFMNIIYPFTVKSDLAMMVGAEASPAQLETINPEHIPIVPPEFARYKGDKIIGNLQNVSFYRVGNYAIQKIDGELYWVAPVEFAGYFAADRAEFSPGYIKISAENENQRAELVADFEMRYIPSAYFSNNLLRMVRQRYPGIVIFEESFEPDEDGKPYYAVTYGSFHKYRSGRVVEGVVLFDPVTGEMEKFTLDEMPDFIDQVIPAEIAGSYNNYFGKYKDGLLNAIFAKRDVSIPTEWSSGEEVLAIFGHDKMMYWFSDFTTPDPESNTMVGYSLIDARTGETTYFTGSRGFLNGYAALEVVDKSFVRENWFGTHPLLYNIYGEDTWVVPVIDPTGLLRQIAIVHAETGTIAYNADKRTAFEEYKFALANRLGDERVIPTTIADIKEIRGTVERVNTLVSQEGTVLLLLLQNHEKVFRVNPYALPFAAFVEPGDQVVIKYIDNDETVVNVREFFNTTINK